VSIGSLFTFALRNIFQVGYQATVLHFRCTWSAKMQVLQNVITSKMILLIFHSVVKKSSLAWCCTHK